MVIVACLGSLFFVFKLSGQKKDMKVQIAGLTSDKTRLEADLGNAKKDLATTKTALAKTTDDFNAATANLQAAQVSLAQKTQEADGLRTQLADKTKEFDQAKVELTSAQETLKKIQDITKSEDFQNFDQIKDRLTNLAEESKILGKQLLTMRDENAALKRQVEELSTTPVNVRGRGAAVQESWGFIVLDIGQSQRVTTNAQFLVYRDSKMVGKVQVVSVGPTTSVAEMMPDFQRSVPKIGDLVVH